MSGVVLVRRRRKEEGGVGATRLGVSEPLIILQRIQDYFRKSLRDQEARRSVTTIQDLLVAGDAIICPRHSIITFRQIYSPIPLIYWTGKYLGVSYGASQGKGID